VVVVEGYEAGPGEGLLLPNNSWIEGDYFASMGIPLIEGRNFDASDDADAPLVVIVDRDFAERYWPNESPIGKRLHMGSSDSNPWHAVVGLVGAVKDRDLGTEDDRGTVYFPLKPAPLNNLNLVIRAAGSEASLGNMVRKTILELDPELPLYDMKMMEMRLADSLVRRKAPMTLLAIFAGVALLLSALGIYGVLAYSVSQRTREIGIRMALGAEPIRILKQVLWQGARLVVLGLMVGAAGAFWLTRLMSSLLYGVEPNDPSVFLMVSLALAVVALVACLIPSRRATQVNAVTALRWE
jgi:predicted permease